MKQFTLSIFAVMAVLLLQNCKKSTEDTTTTVTPVLTATINGTTWTPDTLSATITYNTAAKTKVFAFTGTYSQRRLNCAVTLLNATSANSFTTGSYTTDNNPNPLMLYSTQQKNDQGAYVFVPVATAGLNEGTVTITTVDSAAGLATGTFSFTHKQAAYDSSGNITSVTNTVVAGGVFTNMPYTFVSK